MPVVLSARYQLTVELYSQIELYEVLSVIMIRECKVTSLHQVAERGKKQGWLKGPLVGCFLPWQHYTSLPQMTEQQNQRHWVVLFIKS